MPTTENLPALPPEPTTPTGAPLSRVATEALCFALGHVVRDMTAAHQWGGLCALVEEIKARGVWETMLLDLPMDQARSISALYQFQRGQRWNNTGRQHAPSSPSTARQTIRDGGT
jgi:hypothetical protein